MAHRAHEADRGGSTMEQCARLKRQRAGLQLGQRREDFELDGLLGRGSYACVYRARSRHSGRRVALKVIDKQLIAASPGLADRVRAEAETHIVLDHPAVVKLYNFFEDSSCVYFVMELCEGGELYQHLRKSVGGLQEAEARKMLLMVLDGVKYLHGQHIVHRDLKLSNLLLTKEIQVKISDFGLSTTLEGERGESGTVCGTPNYMPPEVIADTPHGLASDLWSMGCLLYTMLVGVPPFESTSLQMTLDRIRRVDYSIPNTVSKDAADLIRRLLQHCPSHRPSLDAVSKHPFLAVSSNPEHPSPSPFHGPGAALRGRISKGSPSGESALSHGHSSTSCAFADVPGPADGSPTHEPYKSWVSSQSQPHNSPDASHASAHSAEHVVPSSNTHQAPGHERCTQIKTTCHQHNSASSCRDTLPQSRGCNQHGSSSLTTSITSYNCGSGGPHDLLPKQETGRRGVPKLEVPRASEYQNDKSQQHQKHPDQHRPDQGNGQTLRQVAQSLNERYLQHSVKSNHDPDSHGSSGDCSDQLRHHQDHLPHGEENQGKDAFPRQRRANHAESQSGLNANTAHQSQRHQHYGGDPGSFANALLSARSHTIATPVQSARLQAPQSPERDVSNRPSGVVDARWLKAHKYETRHAVVCVRGGGVVEATPHGQETVLVIASCGRRTKVCLRGSEGVWCQYSELEGKWLRLYAYAAKVISMVRSRTPKIVYLSPHAKASLMMDESRAEGKSPTFECNFYCGARAHRASGDSAMRMIGRVASLSEQEALSHAAECLRKCRKAEGSYARQNGMEVDVGEFPLVLAHKRAVHLVTAPMRPPQRRDAHAVSPQGSILSVSDVATIRDFGMARTLDSCTVSDSRSRVSELSDGRSRASTMTSFMSNTSNPRPQRLRRSVGDVPLAQAHSVHSDAQYSRDSAARRSMSDAPLSQAQSVHSDAQQASHSSPDSKHSDSHQGKHADSHQGCANHDLKYPNKQLGGRNCGKEISDASLAGGFTRGEHLDLVLDPNRIFGIAAFPALCDYMRIHSDNLNNCLPETLIRHLVASLCCAEGTEGRVYEFEQGEGQPRVRKTAFFPGFGWVLVLSDDTLWAQMLDGSQIVSAQAQVVCVSPDGGRCVLPADTAMSDKRDTKNSELSRRVALLLGLRELL